MDITIYNPQKGRLETVDVNFTAKNTTWFNDSGSANAVASITDLNGGLLIKRFDKSYPLWLYDLCRTDIDFNRQKAMRLLQQHE